MKQQNQIEKPEWLQALESQSWQAELIASGLAIFGSMEIGNYIERMAYWVLPLFSDSVLNNLRYVFIYLFIAQAILVFSFIIHLVLRIIWAGFLGLSSVYPEGITMNEQSGFTLSFIGKLRKEFPNITAYSIRMDNYCSIIFSILCSAVIIMLSVVVWICVTIALAELIDLYVYPGLGPSLFIVILVALFSVSLLISILTTTPLKKTAFAERFAYPLASRFAKILYLIGYQPVNYILWTLRTNVSFSQFNVGIIVLILPVALYSGFNTGDILTQFTPKAYYYSNNTAARATHDNYLDQIKTSQILRPIIQSREIESDYIKLFIPLMKREEPFREQICGPFE
ncbi:MAG: hypothetical protein AAFP19_26380, partial [Bacteroidota bacterium]